MYLEVLVGLPTVEYDGVCAMGASKSVALRLSLHLAPREKPSSDLNVVGRCSVMCLGRRAREARCGDSSGKGV